jgi:ABC-2 type transport system permease protein
MRKVWVIAVREYLAAVKSKSFIIGIALMPLLMSGGFVAQILLKDQVDLRPKHFAVIDRSPAEEMFRVLEVAVAIRNQQVAGKEGETPKGPNFILERVPAPPEADLPETRYLQSERVRKDELIGVLEIGPRVLESPPGGVVKLALLAEPRAGGADFMKSLPPEMEPYALRYQSNRASYQDFARWAEAAVTAAVMGKRAGKQGIALTDLATVVQPVPLMSKGLTTRDPLTGEIEEGKDQNPIVAILLPGGLIVLMFLLILLGATPLLQGVIEEKMQRIAEVLLGSVQPFGLMMGKIIGMVGVSLTMGSVYIMGAYWGVQHFGYAEYLSGEIIAWFLLYQVLAVFMFGSLYAAVGAACTDMKEAQAMLTPITLVAMVPLFVWINVVREPTSTFSMIISFIPTATPILMLARQAVPPGIPLWQPLVGIAIMLATTLLCVYASGRIFRVGILMQGKGARFGDLVRWVVRG